MEYLTVLGQGPQGVIHKGLQAIGGVSYFPCHGQHVVPQKDGVLVRRLEVGLAMAVIGTLGDGSLEGVGVGKEGVDVGGNLLEVFLLRSGCGLVTKSSLEGSDRGGNVGLVLQ